MCVQLLEAVLKGEESRTSFGGPLPTGGRVQQVWAGQRGVLLSVLLCCDSCLTSSVLWQEMLEHDHLQSSLFACALELVLSSYKSNRYPQLPPHPPPHPPTHTTAG